MKPRGELDPSPLAIPFTFPRIARVQALFTTRIGGAGQAGYAQGNLSYTVGDDPDQVRKNRRGLQLAWGYRELAEVNQVHGHSLVTADDGLSGLEALEADGLATQIEGRALCIKTADCQPLLLAHTSGRYIAALHIGWRGNKALFPANGLRQFCAAYGLQPRQVFAVRGPSLSPQRSQFVNFATDWGPGFDDYLIPQGQTMDLWRLTRDQLLQAGVRSENIFGLDLCTYEQKETFFSYRRDRQCGRQAGLIWIRPTKG